MKFNTDHAALFCDPEGEATPLRFVRQEDLAQADDLTESQRAWLKSNGFTAKQGTWCLMPGGDSGVVCLAGIEQGGDIFEVAALARKLPAGDYRPEGHDTLKGDLALAWAMGGYAFNRYRKPKSTPPRLALAVPAETGCLIEGVFATRDLINTPANDMGPAALEAAFRKLAENHGAEMAVISGDTLLEENFPMVHAVGRASSEAPRVIDLAWGPEDALKVTLVGKGVTFDTGGLNIKPGSSMALMKKDMGGAANVLGLAHMIMAAGLPVRLRVIVGAVENAISGNAFRPGDILASRKGINVEIGNTDAEGRLVLGDCLALGDEEKPQIMIDMATLTGAARVALGPDLPPFYTADDALAEDFCKSGAMVHDPMWRMPLWEPYQEMLSSKVADVNHISNGPFGGSITAALFLSRFVENAESWAHFDIFGWVPADKPWARQGGEAQGIRAIFDTLQRRFSA